MSPSETVPTISGGHSIKVNGAIIHFSDPHVRGRTILQKAGFEPPSDYVLIAVNLPGSNAVGLDENLDLHDGAIREFAAFRSDRSFNFTVDGLGYVWGEAMIGEAELRRISRVNADQVLLLERDGPDIVLAADDVVDLAACGTEHIHTGKKLITVFYRDIPFELERKVYNGSELSAKFGVPANYQLDLIKHDGEFREIGPTTPLKVREGMHFVSHPPCGHSS